MMAGHQKSQSVRIFLEKVENYNDQSLAAFLFPIDDSEAPRITQAIADDVRSSEELKKRVNQAFLLLMKGYGFYRRQVNPSVSKLPSIFLSVSKYLRHVPAVSPHRACTSAQFLTERRNADSKISLGAYPPEAKELEDYETGRTNLAL